MVEVVDDVEEVVVVVVGFEDVVAECNHLRFSIFI